jgi:cystinosin
VLSLVQEVLDAGCSGDWAALTGDPVKLALGFVTMVFDSIFIVQHYCLYPAAKHGLHSYKELSATELSATTRCST